MTGPTTSPRERWMLAWLDEYLVRGGDAREAAVERAAPRAEQLHRQGVCPEVAGEFTARESRLERLLEAHRRLAAHAFARITRVESLLRARTEQSS